MNGAAMPAATAAKKEGASAHVDVRSGAKKDMAGRGRIQAEGAQTTREESGLSLGSRADREQREYPPLASLPLHRTGIGPQRCALS